MSSGEETKRQIHVAGSAADWVEVARENESQLSRIARKVSSMFSSASEWLRPDPPEGALPLPSALSQAMLTRHSLTDFLTYREYDDARGLMYLTCSDSFRAGFILGFSPLLSAGTDVESQLEAVVNNCPADSVMQIGVLSGGQVSYKLNEWLRGRILDNPHPLLQEQALRRAEYFDAAANAGGTLLLAGSGFQPREIFYYISVTVPYTGDHQDAAEMEIFLKTVTELRVTLEGSLKGAQIPAYPLDRSRVEFLLHELLSPQYSPEERRSFMQSGPLPGCLQQKSARVRVHNNGLLGFMNGDQARPEASEIFASVLTMDAPPAEGYLPLTARLMGHPLSRDDRISCPFWMHTTIHIQHPEKAKDRLVMKVGSLNKQLMSDSPWYRSMMGHLYTQKDELDQLVAAGRLGHPPVRVWSGIVLYDTFDRIKRETEYVANLWRKAGFRCSREHFIALPVFLAGLPLMYDPGSDTPGRGLQRSNTMSSFNAATLLHVQGDWQGTAPRRAGPLFISRRGQLATIDLFDSDSNYNFTIVAKSGSGKSFLANELAVDILSRNGVVRIFDVGRSYKRFASVNGGTILEFAADKPVSLNPFYGIKTHQELNELIPVLKSLIRQMAFPLSSDETFETAYNWQYQAIEVAITQAWERHRENTGLEHVYDWLATQEDATGQNRYQDLAFLLHSFAVGRYAPWFNGPRQIDMSNDLVIVELEDLEVDPDLQAVVLTLMIHQITKDMYLSDPERKRPKMLLVDEGWRLLGDKQSGGFISKAFRTIRKYRGTAGVITQAYNDFAASQSARAALENSSWQFVLAQSPESIDVAVSQKWVSDDDQLVDLLKSVQSDAKAGFSEVYVKGDKGSGVYRFVPDRHSYWLYTSNPVDISKLAEVQATGKTLMEAVDYLARQDYQMRGHPFVPREGSLREFHGLV